MKFPFIALSAVLLIAIGFVLFSGDPAPDTSSPSTYEAQNRDEKQVVEIEAKGGYFPQKSKAKAGVPTVIKMKTSGTFDCSSALAIPSLGYRQSLPLSGETLIDVPAQQAGSTLEGMCGMGMYHFSIDFS